MLNIHPCYLCYLLFDINFEYSTVDSNSSPVAWSGAGVGGVPLWFPAHSLLLFHVWYYCANALYMSDNEFN